MRIGTWHFEGTWSPDHDARAGIVSSRDLTRNQALEGREGPSVHRPVLAVDREVLALGLLATSDGGAT